MAIHAFAPAPAAQQQPQIGQKSFWSRISDAITSFRGKSGDLSPEAWWDTYTYPQRSSTGLPVNQYTTLQVTTAMACVTVLAEDVAKLPLHVYERLGKGGKRIVDDHPLEKLFVAPNDWQTRFEFVEMMMQSLALRGNAYAVILRNWRGVPTALVPLNPDRIWIYEAPDGQIFYQVARRGMHEIAVLRDMPFMIASEDMLHIRWMAQDSSLWGISRIAAAREAIGLSLAQQELASRMSANGASLGVALQTDQKLTDQVYNRLKQSWRENYSGLRNAGETAILEQGLKLEKFGMTAVDAEFLNSRKFSVEEVARMFRVPLHKIGVLGSHATGTSLVQLDQEYLNSTLSSWCQRIAAKFAQCFGVGGTMHVGFDYADFLKADMQTRLTSARTGIIGGIYTPNEVRRGEELPDIDGGDDLFMPTNMLPIKKLGQPPPGAGPGSDLTGDGAEGGAGDAAGPSADSAPGV